MWEIKAIMMIIVTVTKKNPPKNDQIHTRVKFNHHNTRHPPMSLYDSARNLYERRFCMNFPVYPLIFSCTTWLSSFPKRKTSSFFATTFGVFATFFIIIMGKSLSEDRKKDILRRRSAGETMKYRSRYIKKLSSFQCYHPSQFTNWE